MYSPPGTDSGHEWFEIYNTTNKTIFLDKSSLGLIDEKEERDAEGKLKNTCHTFSENLEIDSKEFLVIADNKKNFILDYPLFSEKILDSVVSLSNSEDTIKLSFDRCQTWETEITYKDSWGGDGNNKTLEKINFAKNNSKENWQESYILSGTPGEKSSKKPEPVNYEGEIEINEIYPAPNTKDGEEEFVEIINSSKEKIDFSGWIIKDSKGAKGKISKIKEDKNFVVFYGKFSLNNDSKGDDVFLYDEKGNLVSNQKYNSGKSKYSYSFNDKEWRWTSTATPGEENIFDKILSGKLILPKKIYKNTYAYFEVKADKDAKKFTWDFGDGHKSYLKSTKHKYAETGKFQASLKITGNGEDKLYEFEVKVEKYDAPKVRIISFMPNPKGLDENEWIEIKNESKKKVNLKDWSIATGWKKLVNHPIRKDFQIKPGKTKKLPRDICAFTLVNTKDKIELRDPSGKAVQKIKYDHGKKSIAEDEIYSKVDGKWIWIEPQNTTEEKTQTPPLPLGENVRRTGEGASDTIEEIIPDLGKYSLSPDWQKKQKDRQILAYSSHSLTLPEKFLSQNPRVLGAKTTKTKGDFYIFTWNNTQKHWLLAFLDSNWIKINSKLNKLLFKL